jgi:uncharacterized protein with HEPN domain
MNETPTITAPKTLPPKTHRPQSALAWPIGSCLTNRRFCNSPIATVRSISVFLAPYLETLADASQKLPETWRSSESTESTIDWVGITEFRDFLVHQYFLAHQYLEINLDIVWHVVTEELPPLKIAIDRIAEGFWS